MVTVIFGKKWIFAAKFQGARLLIGVLEYWNNVRNPWISKSSILPFQYSALRVMATGVFDLDFEKLPQEITGLNGYNRAFVLMRQGGRPVGKEWVPVRDGCIKGVDLCSALVKAGGWALTTFCSRIGVDNTLCY